ncbi:sigma-54-dependent Fis family transcriptional regulator [Desulfopila sp. IMCC35006]|uniref:sigma-54-dependent transcriptional regulator n=1 Tax=Desulfopila sp. IMCC35006 TaxID=2569542 RepID=UPI0010AD15CA|nr:sigma-54 dependent transcriptional regulator [Desulfopila sp. IMCC35006]TKB27083.1 sigma-54-dependent Fis family transcriptional regulator [Desulfopila sp. IMCC35006]
MNKVIHVLIVDDETPILEVLDARLTAAGFVTHKASSGHEAFEILNNDRVDVLVSDIKMPEMSGLELLDKIRPNFPQLPVIFLTAYGTIPNAVDAIKAGAVDYLTKPFDGKELVQKIEKIVAKVWQPVESRPEIENGMVWGKSAAMTELKEILLKVAVSNANVLILGESGVGKECIARMVHNLSPRKNKPYIVVDCGSTPSGILESELFGHVKGSFTHAISDKKGLIEAAQGGTLFLDEVGNISQDMQSRLLRFLEERTIRQVGAIKEIDVDCRVISATNADLKADAEEGKFRLDLYYRLKVVTLTVPPLRERREDIPELAQFLVDSYTEDNSLPRLMLPQKTLDWLQTLSWPGNVRELKNALETGIILCKNNQILPEDLQLDNESMCIIDKGSDPNFSIEQSEKEAIIRALKQTKGVKKDAAELLGISRRAIQYKSKKYDLDASEFKS